MRLSVFLACLLLALPVHAEDGALAPANPRACVLLPLSGPHGGLGKRVLEAIETAWAEGNMAPLAHHDTAGGVGVVARAVEEGCVGAIGGLGDKEAIALADAAEAASLPLLALGSVLDGRARPHVVFMRTARARLLGALASYLVSNGVSSAVVLHGHDAFGRLAAASFKEAFEADHGRVLAVLPVPNTAKEQNEVAGRLATELGRGRECTRLAVFLAADIGLSARFVPFLDFHGVTRGKQDCPAPVLAGTSLWNDPVLVARRGEALEGGIFADVVVPSGEAALLAEAADAAVLLATAVRAGRTSEGVAQVLSGEVSFRGHTGEVRLSEGAIQGRKVGIFTIRRGEIVPLPQDEGR